MTCCSKSSKNIKSRDNISLEGLICYCFQYSKKELFIAVKNSSEQDIIDDVKVKMKDPGCFCETANPSGKCCLGDINHFIKQAKSIQNDE